MSLYQASFKVKHECPYRTVSERYPDLTIREWFMNEHQILEVSAPRSPTDELTEAVADLGSVLYEANDDSNLYAVVRSCLCSLDDSLISSFEAHNCLYVPPTIYHQGWEHYTVTAFADNDVRALLQDLDDDRDIEVLSTKAADIQRVPHSLFTSLDSLFDGLTARQMDALRIALDNDYFEQPRGASIEELAQQTNVARSTYEEHLRKAQNTLIANTENFVRLVTEMDTAEKFRKTRPRTRSMG
ncbi:MAG: helix-turn-helix domain-containing protein [Haloarcula sp.]